MSNLTKLTQSQVEKIQFDEGVTFIDYGETSERLLAPCRGGGEFNATVTIRDIDFDGKTGKTAGTQIIDEIAAVLKINSLCMAQDNLKLALPNCIASGSGDAAIIKNPRCGVIPLTAYLKNVTMFCKTLDGKYKRIKIFNPMSENGLAIKAVQKSEAEVALEFNAHQSYSDLNGDLFEIKEIDEYIAPLFVSAETTSDGTKVKVTFSHIMSSTGLVKIDFDVNVSDVNAEISSIALNADDAHIVELTMLAAIDEAKTIDVSYTKGTCVDSAGNSLASFSKYAVKNNA